MFELKDIYVPLNLSNVVIEGLEEEFERVARDVFMEMQKSTQVKPYMNKKEAANYIGVSFNTLQKFIHEGLPVVIIGGIQMIRKEDVDAFMLSNRNI